MLREPVRPRHGAITAPYYAYSTAPTVVAGRGCGTGSSSVTGLAFYTAAATYPAAYQGALFFADYSRKCIWAMTTAGSRPAPSPQSRDDQVRRGRPVNLVAGPGGDIFYPGFDDGRLHRIDTSPAACRRQR